jgi:2-methylcitrate dehydratase PrpD
MSSYKSISDSNSLEWKLAEFCSRLQYDDLPKGVIARSELLLADVVSCMLLAAGDKQFRQLAKKLSVDSPGQAGAIGVGYTSAEIAAQVNAIAAHWFEWDDVYDEGALHITAVVVPAMLAAAATAIKRDDSVARDFIVSLVAAIEVSCRIGKVVLPGLKTGWMPTGIACAIGAAAGAAKLQGAALDVVSSAMGLAATACGTGRQPLADMVNGKSVLCSQVALNAYSASRLALAGVRGSIRHLSGPFAVGPLFLDREVDLDTAADNLGSVFTLHNIKLKRYPSCRATHQAIDAVMGLKAELARQDARFGEIDDIRSVTVSVPGQAYELCGAPYSDGPDKRVGRQFSIAYLVAAALIRGDVTPDLYIDRGSEHERRVAALAQKTQIVRSMQEHQNTSFPQATELRVLYKSGAVHQWKPTDASVASIDDHELIKKKLAFVDCNILARARGFGLIEAGGSVEIDIDTLVKQLGAIA